MVSLLYNLAGLSVKLSHELNSHCISEQQIDDLASSLMWGLGKLHHYINPRFPVWVTNCDGFQSCDDFQNIIPRSTNKIDF